MLVRAVESVTAGRENSSEVEPDVLTWPYGGIGGMCNLVAGLMLGRHTTILDKFNVDEWVAAVRQRQPSISSGPPAVARMVLDAQVPPEDIASIRDRKRVVEGKSVSLRVVLGGRRTIKK